MKIVLTKRTLDMLVACTHKDKFALSGIYVQEFEDAVILTASNTHVLYSRTGNGETYRTRPDDDAVASGVVPARIFKALCEVGKRKMFKKTVYEVDSSTLINGKVDEWTFPRYNEIIDKTPGGPCVLTVSDRDFFQHTNGFGFNVEYVKLFAKYAESGSDKLEFCGDSDKHTAKVHRDRESVSVIMPVCY